MKRDWDLVRKILMSAEELADANSHVTSNDLDGHDAELVAYHMRLLIDAGLAQGRCMQGLGGPESCVIMSLTWEGHEFLDKIRNNGVWNRVKTVAREKGLSLSFDVIKIAAKAAIEQMLS